MASTAKYFELALTYLLKNRIKYNDLAKLKQKEKGTYNFDFTNAYGQMIGEFKNTINTKIMKVSAENKLSNFGNFQNIWNSIGVNVNDFPLSKFLLSMIPDIDFYPQIIKQLIMDYSRIFNEDDYKLNYNDDVEIIVLYFGKLLVKVLYQFNNEPIKYLNDINALNNLTRQYVIEYHMMGNYNSYHSDIVHKIIKPNKENIKPIIEYLEQQCKNIELIEKLQAKMDVKLELPIEIPKATKSKEDIPNAEIPKEIKTKEKEPKAPKAKKDDIKSDKSKKIPSAVRKIVWNTYIGKDNTTGKCLVCSSEDISHTNFECGHVKSRVNGGDVTVDNLRPICGNCNKSIGGNDMDEFMDKFKIKKPENWDGFKPQVEPENNQKKRITKLKGGDILEADIDLQVDLEVELQDDKQTLNFEINRNTYNNVYKCICKESCGGECKILESTITEHKDAINKQLMNYYLDSISKTYHIEKININIEKKLIKIIVDINKSKSKKSGNMKLYYTNNLDDTKTIKHKKLLAQDNDNHIWLYEL
jgi:5-methylcytosine-specific restriction endonuclease McrA